MSAENETSSPWKMPFPSSTGEVRKGATDIQELAERVTAVLKERLTTCSEHGTSFTAASGELVKATASITVTLPAVATNTTVAVLANGHEVDVSAGSTLIYGDFITGTTAIALVGYQHIVLQSDGTNWFIMAGEPKREQAYTKVSLHAAEAETGEIPSTTRPALVTTTFFAESGKNGSASFNVGGVVVGSVGVAAGAPAYAEAPVTFYVPPGVRWAMSHVSHCYAVTVATILL
jgi:hypothetical protein